MGRGEEHIITNKIDRYLNEAKASPLSMKYSGHTKKAVAKLIASIAKPKDFNAALDDVLENAYRDGYDKGWAEADMGDYL